MRTLRLLLLALPLGASLALSGCLNGPYEPIMYACEPDSDEITDRMRDPLHCVYCRRRCMLPGIRAEDQHCDHGCLIGPGVECVPGYIDADGEPYNGCECRGDDAETCQLCEPEIPYNAVDDDCDLRVDEIVPPEIDIRPPIVPGRSEHPDRVNGPEGALYVTPPAVSRLSCAGAPCALPPGALDVRCVDLTIGRRCEGVYPPAPDLTGADRGSGGYPGRQKRGPEVDCTNGIDDDQNGVIDDGPHCETLVAAVRHPECHGVSPSHGCAPTWVPLDAYPGLPDASGPTVAVMTYDALVDRREATVGQVRRWLDETGQCERPLGSPHPLCASEADPETAAGYLDWCDAYAYCQWMGKRLPTELEWIQGFGGHLTPTFETVDGACGETEARVPECSPDGPRTVGEPGGHVDKGNGYISTVYDVGGNMAEWLFDARVEPCELPWIGCQGDTWGYSTPFDPVVPAPYHDPYRARILRGGGFGSEYGAASPRARQWADPGVHVPHYGVRCARTFEPKIYNRSARVPDPQTVPYDRTLAADQHGRCERWPVAGAIARRTPNWLGQAVEACIASPFEPEPMRVLAQRLTWPVRPLLLNIERTQSGSAVILAAPGLVPGVEALWLADHPPLESYHRGRCASEDCAFDLGGPWPWAVELPDEGEAIIHTLAGQALPPGGSCLGPADPDLVVWAFEVEIPRAALNKLPEASQHTDAACTAFGCASPVKEGERCAEACKAWRVPMHVGFRRLSVP